MRTEGGAAARAGGAGAGAGAGAASAQRGRVSEGGKQFSEKLKTMAVLAVSPKKLNISPAYLSLADPETSSLPTDVIKTLYKTDKRLFSRLDMALKLEGEKPVIVIDFLSFFADHGWVYNKGLTSVFCNANFNKTELGPFEYRETAQLKCDSQFKSTALQKKVYKIKQWRAFFDQVVANEIPVVILSRQVNPAVVKHVLNVINIKIKETLPPYIQVGCVDLLSLHDAKDRFDKTYSTALDHAVPPTGFKQGLYRAYLKQSFPFYVQFQDALTALEANEALTRTTKNSVLFPVASAETPADDSSALSLDLTVSTDRSGVPAGDTSALSLNTTGGADSTKLAEESAVVAPAGGGSFSASLADAGGASHSAVDLDGFGSSSSSLDDGLAILGAAVTAADAPAGRTHESVLAGLAAGDSSAHLDVDETSGLDPASLHVGASAAGSPGPAGHLSSAFGVAEGAGPDVIASGASSPAETVSTGEGSSADYRPLAPVDLRSGASHDSRDSRSGDDDTSSSVEEFSFEGDTVPAPSTDRTDATGGFEGLDFLAVETSAPAAADGFGAHADPAVTTEVGGGTPPAASVAHTSAESVAGSPAEETGAPGDSDVATLVAEPAAAPAAAGSLTPPALGAIAPGVSSTPPEAADVASAAPGAVASSAPSVSPEPAVAPVATDGSGTHAGPVATPVVGGGVPAAAPTEVVPGGPALGDPSLLPAAALVAAPAPAAPAAGRGSDGVAPRAVRSPSASGTDGVSHVVTSPASAAPTDIAPGSPASRRPSTAPTAAPAPAAGRSDPSSATAAVAEVGVAGSGAPSTLAELAALDAKKKSAELHQAPFQTDSKKPTEKAKDSYRTTTFGVMAFMVMLHFCAPKFPIAAQFLVTSLPHAIDMSVFILSLAAVAYLFIRFAVATGLRAQSTLQSGGERSPAAGSDDFQRGMAVSAAGPGLGANVQNHQAINGYS